MNRPAIPAETAKAVLIEAGHRCAVCGVPCPLERAHIVPWRKSQNHSVGNLICLCANCHERADRERWGEEALREYKANPWVHRQNPVSQETSSFGLVQIVIRKEMHNFDDHYLEMLRYALAKFLDTDPKAIKVVARKRGSVKIIIECPSGVAAELMARFNNNRDDLQGSLPLFPVDAVEAILSGELPLTVVEGTPVEGELLNLVRKALSKLPAQYRQFIYLNFVEQRNHEEIRIQLGISSHSGFLKLQRQAFEALKQGMQETWEGK